MFKTDSRNVRKEKSGSIHKQNESALSSELDDDECEQAHKDSTNDEGDDKQGKGQPESDEEHPRRK